MALAHRLTPLRQRLRPIPLPHRAQAYAHDSASSKAQINELVNQMRKQASLTQPRSSPTPSPTNEDALSLRALSQASSRYPPSASSTLGSASAAANKTPSGNTPSPTSSLTSSHLSALSSSAPPLSRPEDDFFGALHKLHVYSHKHNTIVTLTRPNRDPLLTLSTGMINFRKAQRGTFDAAYQLVSYAVAQIVEKGLLSQIARLELVFRGYGKGREAFQKVLLGTEGRVLKGLVRKVTDVTRLKFGGCRSRKVRRL